MKKALAFSMAAVMALSSSVCAYAEGRDEAELRTMLSRVKDRIEIPTELEEFNYRVSTSAPREEYTFTWSTPNDAEEYKDISCTICSTVITEYSRSDVNSYRRGEAALAELSEAQLYQKALKAVKQLNPGVYKSISVDEDSLSVSLRGNLASFKIVRTKNGIPVANDSGRIWLDKNTGELARFQLNWHPNATFRSAKTIISEDKAKDAYAEMIDINPRYEIIFDGDSKAYVSRIVYGQEDYGEINAFTGKKSDFAADGYYGDETMEAAADEETEAGAADNGGFTQQELAEITKELPFSNEKAIVELMESNKYMSYSEDLGLGYSRLYKTEFNDNETYVYSASFDSFSDKEDEEPTYSSHYESINIAVNAETGEIMRYNYYNSSAISQTRNFDKEKMTALATDIAKEFAGERFGEYEFDYGDANSYTDEVGNVFYYGSYFSWLRMVNGLAVSGDDISINFGADGVLTSYNINYSDVEFQSPDDILTEDEIMDIFWAENDINLYYLARVHDRKTKTVLVYGVDNTVYCDAFTGEQLYSRYITEDGNTADITDKALRQKAEVLEAHGLSVTSGMKSADDTVSAGVYARVINYICSMGMYGQYDKIPLSFSEYDDAAKLTNADAMVMFTAAECGTAVPALEGIFKSPYTDVKDSDPNVGYYAIASALIGDGRTALDAAESFTYADMIELIYTYLDN